MNPYGYQQGLNAPKPSDYPMLGGYGLYPPQYAMQNQARAGQFLFNPQFDQGQMGFYQQTYNGTLAQPSMTRASITAPPSDLGIQRPLEQPRFDQQRPDHFARPE